MRVHWPGLSGGVIIGSIVLATAGCGGTRDLDVSTNPENPVAGPAPVESEDPDDWTGGFGSPARVAGEFDLGPGRPVSGVLRLADDGCWYAEFEDATALAILPVGFEIPFQTDPTSLLGPNGTTYTSGTAIDGMVHQVWPEELPGGADGRWGHYVTFCEPAEPSVAVFEDLWPAEVPMALSEAELIDLVTDATLSVDRHCGRGWAASSDDERVGLFVYQQSSQRLEAGATVELPHEEWTARLVVGKYLFLNHCDDVFEPWEPNQIIAAEWPVTGMLEVLDTFPETEEPAPAAVRALLSGAQVTTSRGVIDLGDIELANDSFNFLPG
jgi:hypothetical protein